MFICNFCLPESSFSAGLGDPNLKMRENVLCVNLLDDDAPELKFNFKVDPPPSDAIENENWNPSSLAGNFGLGTKEGVIRLLCLKNVAILGAQPGRTTLVLRGLCSLAVLRGKVTCLGYEMTPRMDSFRQLCSPQSHSFLALETEADDVSTTIELKLFPNFDEEQLLRLEHSIRDNECGVIFAVKPLQSKISQYIKSFNPHLLSPHRANVAYGWKNFSLEEFNSESSAWVTIPGEWKSAVAKVFQSSKVECLGSLEPYIAISTCVAAPVVLVCGPANVGKSTFIRYMMNSHISR